MEEKKVITPIHFVDKEEKKEEPKKNDAELNFKCKYGSINIKLGEIPIIKNFV